MSSSFVTYYLENKHIIIIISSSEIAGNEQNLTK
jgi:hypothetical protein